MSSGCTFVRAATGSLTVYVRNQNGSYTSGAKVFRYSSSWTYIDQVSTDSSGKAYWSSVTIATYNIEVYYPSPAALAYTEFWGSDTVVMTGSTTKYFDRHTQWVTDIKINSQSLGSVSVNPGSKIHVDVTVRNIEAGASSMSVIATVILDRDRTSPYDIPNQDRTATINYNAYGYFGWDFYPTTSGTYYIYVIIKGLYNSQYIVTDQYNWASAFSVNLWQLTVSSAHDSPSPSNGNWLYTNGQSVTCTVSSQVTEGGTVWVCTGWTGTGSVPSSGTGNSVTFSITQDSTITWNWQAKQSLTVNSLHGSPVPATGSWLYNYGDSVTCSVSSPVTESSTVWVCTGWSGSVPSSGTGLTTTFTITQDSSITWNWVAVLSNPSVAPTGDSLTVFTYSVKYYDPQGVVPYYHDIVIDGILQLPMSKSSGSYSDGTYVYSTTLDPGSHTYYFIFGSVFDQHRLPSVGNLVDPFVSFDYRIRPLYSDITVQKDGTLNLYFQIVKYDGLNYIPTNGVQVTFRSSLDSQDITDYSGRLKNLDGIVSRTYQITPFVSSFSVTFAPAFRYQGVPVVPPLTNPLTYSLSDRQSQLVVGIENGASASYKFLMVEGYYGQEFAVSNDGTNILDISYSDSGKIGGGVAVEAPHVDLGPATVGVDSGGSVTLGFISGSEWQFKNPQDQTQNRIVKNCISDWILTTLMARYPYMNVGSILQSARLLLDYENHLLLGMDNYKTNTNGAGYINAQADANIGLFVLTQKTGKATIQVGANFNVEGEAEIGFNVYSLDRIGVYGDFTFSAQLGAGIDLGFSKVRRADGSVSLLSVSIEVKAELIYEYGHLSKIEFTYKFECPNDLSNQLIFDGLSSPLQNVNFPIIPSPLHTTALCISYEMPAEKMDQPLRDYINSLPMGGNVELWTLWNLLSSYVSSSTNTPIPYSIWLESRYDLPLSLGVHLSIIGAEASFLAYQTQTAILEQGFVFNQEKFPIEQHSNIPASIDLTQFILDSWLYSGNSPQPSGTVITIDKNIAGLYLNVYDNQGRHTGLIPPHLRSKNRYRDLSIASTVMEQLA